MTIKDGNDVEDETAQSQSSSGRAKRTGATARVHALAAKRKMPSKTLEKHMCRVPGKGHPDFSEHPEGMFLLCVCACGASACTRAVGRSTRVPASLCRRGLTNCVPG